MSVWFSFFRFSDSWRSGLVFPVEWTLRIHLIHYWLLLFIPHDGHELIAIRIDYILLRSCSTTVWKIKLFKFFLNSNSKLWWFYDFNRAANSIEIKISFDCGIYEFIAICNNWKNFIWFLHSFNPSVFNEFIQCCILK